MGPSHLEDWLRQPVKDCFLTCLMFCHGFIEPIKKVGSA